MEFTGAPEEIRTSPDPPHFNRGPPYRQAGFRDIPATVIKPIGLTLCNFDVIFSENALLYALQGGRAGDHRSPLRADRPRLPQCAGAFAAYRVGKIAGAGHDHEEARRAIARRRRSTSSDSRAL